jgi:type II secretory pathway predicted ATPase ExeA
MILSEVMEFYGIERDFQGCGFFETEQHRQLMKAIRPALLSGKLVAVTGLVGSGKTLFLQRFEAALKEEGRFIVARSLSVDKERTTLTTLITALFYDLSSDKTPRIPQGEERERALRELVRRGRKPVVLIVDESHDLHPRTLIRLKRLMEVVADGGGTLAIVLTGHPKLRNDLRRPTMEEIGSRSALFAHEGIGEDRRAYIAWLLTTCAVKGVPVAAMIDDTAIGLLADRLRTPLQIEKYLDLAFEHGFRGGVKPITAEVVETVLSRQLDDLEPRLTRHGYNVRNLAAQFHTKPAEMRQFLRGALDEQRTHELTEQMRTAGLPL